MDLIQLAINSFNGPTGYVVLFGVTLILSASLFFPVPVFAITIAAAQVMDPLLVGIIAGVASGIGELSGYFIGLGGEKVLEKKGREGARYKRIKSLFQRYGFFGISLAAFFPITPIDFVGILAGTLEYGWRRFLLATIIGKIPRYLLVAYLGNAIIGFIF